jgi:DNA replication and repair protein RecF
VDINGQSAKLYGSQGQTRTAALSLKLAQREIFQEETGEWPVLLLDDVLSELDHKRQAFVLNRIRGGQVFITCCEDEKLEGLEGGKAFRIQNGTIVMNT